jgi:putative spermidine/putrescine transport system permease protein
MNTAPLPVRIAAHALAGLVLAFLVLPILAVVPASFNHATFIYLPPKAVSWRWYDSFFADKEWMTTLLNSLEVAVLVTLLSVALGTLAALGLERMGRRGRVALAGLFMAPMIVPVIITGVALYRSAIEIELSGTIWAVLLGHTVLALPLVIINVGISLRAVDPNWLRAATGLGAGPWTVFRSITLPNILPGLVGGGVFAFLTSFDEVVVSIFLAGHQGKTLPVKMWEAIRIELTPEAAVAATMMILLAVVLFVAARLATRRKEASR